MRIAHLTTNLSELALLLMFVLRWWLVDLLWRLVMSWWLHLHWWAWRTLVWYCLLLKRRVRDHWTLVLSLHWWWPVIDRVSVNRTEFKDIQHLDIVARKQTPS